MGWEGARALLGIAPEEAGGPLDRVLAQVVLEQVIEAHNRAVKSST
jgi:hypothetical protein